jgi:hypothetical protein
MEFVRYGVEHCRSMRRAGMPSSGVLRRRPARRAAAACGASLLEFALIVPLLLILIANIVNFAGFFFAWITVQDAARAGAQYLVRGDKSLGDPAPVAPLPESGLAALISPVVTQELSSLVNNPSLALRVCTRKPSGRGISATAPTITCTQVTGSFSTTPSDPPEEGSAEAPLYETGWVDVGYTYLPFIPSGFKFPGLNFGPVWPSKDGGVTIHRQVVMRILS